MYVQTMSGFSGYGGLGAAAPPTNASAIASVEKENAKRKSAHASAIAKHDRIVALYRVKLTEWEGRVNALTAQHERDLATHAARLRGIQQGDAVAEAQYGAAMQRWNQLRAAYDQAMAARSAAVSQMRGALASSSARVLAKWSIAPPPGFNGVCVTAAQREGFANACANLSIRGLGATTEEDRRRSCGWQELPVCPADPPVPVPVPGAPPRPQRTSLPAPPSAPRMPARPSAPPSAPPPPKLRAPPRPVYPGPPPKPPMLAVPAPPPEYSPPPPPAVEIEDEGGGNFAVMGILGIVAVAGAGYLIFRKKRPAAA